MASGTIIGTKYISSHYWLEIRWSSTSDTSTNKSSVTAAVWFHADSGWSIDSSAGKTVTVTINGTAYTFSAPRVYSTGSTYNLNMGSKTGSVTHNSDGTKSITISASFNPNANMGGYGTLGNMTASGTATLDNIPRYATVTQSNTSKTETKITMSWTANATCDRYRYSTNGGSSWSAWVTGDRTSGSYTITGLTPNTSYSIVTEVRRKDSQLSSQTSALSVKTLALPTSVVSVQSKTETSVTIKWSSGDTIDYTWYSTDNGSTWTAKDVTDGTSGTYTISGLSANTTYKIKIRVRKKSTQATNESSAVSVATYNWPYATTMPDFTIGSSVKITIYNPLSRSVTLSMRDSSNNLIGSTNIVTGTTITGFNGAAYTTDLYASIPSATSGTYKIRCVYSGHTMDKTGGTYSINASKCTPTIGTITALDQKASVVAITGSSSAIVRNKSQVQVKAASLTAKNSASISSCTYTYTGQSNAQAMTISGSTATATANKTFGSTPTTVTVKLTDSRGLTATKTLSVTVINYANPAATISLKRENSYYTQTYLKVVGNISPVYVGGTAKNAITSITYNTKRADTNTWAGAQSISNNTQYTFPTEFSNDYAWDFRIKITDTFGITTTYNLQLPRGIPLVMFDRKRGSVGVNTLPSRNGSFEAGGFFFLKQPDANNSPSLFFNDTNDNILGRVMAYRDTATYPRRFYVSSRLNDDTHYENYCFPNPNLAGTANVTYDILTTKTVNLVEDIPSSSTSIPSAATTNVTSIYLAAGTYIVTGQVGFASNQTGSRSVYIGTGGTGAQIARNTVPAWNAIIAVNASTVFTSTGQTIYLNAYQNSGGPLSTQTASTWIKAIRIL